MKYDLNPNAGSHGTSLVSFKSLIPAITLVITILGFHVNTFGQYNNDITYTKPANKSFVTYIAPKPYYNPSIYRDSTGKDSTVKDTLSKFDRTNQKMEALFKIIPVPLISYSSDGGNLFGLAKFNSFQLSKKDTISKPSVLSAVASVTTKGRVNFSVATQLVFNEDKYILISYVNYKKQPEYLFPIGNTIYPRDSLEEITYERFKFVATGLRRWAKNFYAGIAFDLAYYDDIKTDSSNFLKRETESGNLIGLEGGTDFGVGLSAAYDSRDSRYTPSTGAYVIGTALTYSKGLGSTHDFTKYTLDARKFFNPWKKHVIALQATTTSTNKEVPFYSMAMLGGDSKMRGYYEGALRDKVLVDGQIEYRMPIWKIFGLVTWVGAGRTSPNYNSLSIDDFHLNWGGGFRVRVDSKSNINLRVDFGFGPGGITGTYLNFTEAF